MGHTRGLHLKAEFERGNRADENRCVGRRTAQERVTGGRWRRIVLGDVLAEHVVARSILSPVTMHCVVYVSCSVRNQLFCLLSVCRRRTAQERCHLSSFTEHK